MPTIIALAIEGRDGAKVGAIDETLLRGKAATIAKPAPLGPQGWRSAAK